MNYRAYRSVCQGSNTKKGVSFAKREEWYAKQQSRDQKARRQYFDVERFKRQRGDLYIMQIMDEEMKPNDPRLS